MIFDCIIGNHIGISCVEKHRSLVTGVLPSPRWAARPARDSRARRIPSPSQKDVAPRCGVSYYQETAFLRPNPAELGAFGG